MADKHITDLDESTNPESTDLLYIVTGGATPTDAKVTIGNVVAAGGAVVGTGITAIVALTQAQYDALSPPSATTLYVING